MKNQEITHEGMGLHTVVRCIACGKTLFAKKYTTDKSWFLALEKFDRHKCRGVKNDRNKK